MFSRPAFAALFVLALAACGGDAPSAIGRLPADTQGPRPAAVLRVPRKGGAASLYRVPSLAPLAWEERDKLGDVAGLIGASEDQHSVFLLDENQRVQQLNFQSSRAEPVLGGIRHAALGPAGTLLALDTGRTVLRLTRGSVTRMRGKASGAARALIGTGGGQVLVATGGRGGGVAVFSPDAAPQDAGLPAGTVTGTDWGDLLAVGTDTGLVLYAPHNTPAIRRVDFRGAVHAVSFSPSGHRIYLIGQDSSRLVVVDRFGREVLSRVRLPGPASDLRTDQLGRWLLIRPARGDSVWVVDPAVGQVVGAAPSGWSSDLPAVAGEATLLARVGRNVVARDLAKPGLPETGRVDGGAADLWLPLSWVPATAHAEADTAAADTSGAGETAAAAPERVYLQVSSSQNGDWARSLMNQLRQAGLPASVLAPKTSDEPYRVVLGPYRSRAEAEAAAETLGRPSFIIRTDTTDSAGP